MGWLAGREDIQAQGHIENKIRQDDQFGMKIFYKFTQRNSPLSDALRVLFRSITYYLTANRAYLGAQWFGNIHSCVMAEPISPTLVSFLQEEISSEFEIVCAIYAPELLYGVKTVLSKTYFVWWVMFIQIQNYTVMLAFLEVIKKSWLKGCQLVGLAINDLGVCAVPLGSLHVLLIASSFLLTVTWVPRNGTIGTVQNEIPFEN